MRFTLRGVTKFALTGNIARERVVQYWPSRNAMVVARRTIRTSNRERCTVPIPYERPPRSDGDFDDPGLEDNAETSNESEEGTARELAIADMEDEEHDDFPIDAAGNAGFGFGEPQD